MRFSVDAERLSFLGEGQSQNLFWFRERKVGSCYITFTVLSLISHKYEIGLPPKGDRLPFKANSSHYSYEKSARWSV